jgi:hypothetical protein
MSKTRNWTFTSWQYIEPESINQSKIKYFICGHEFGSEGKTEHWQCFVVFNQVKRMNEVKKFFNNYTMHLEPSKGTPLQNKTYCSKEANEIYELGDLGKTGQGARSDLIDVAEKIKLGANKITIATENPVEYIKFHKGIEKLINIQTESKFETGLLESLPTLRPDQLNLIEQLESFNKGEVRWFVDYQGGWGKSTLTDYLCATKNALKFDSPKFTDCAYIYNGEPIVIFDLPRSIIFGPELYQCIENFCNRQILSTKYEVCRKLCPAKVLVFSNNDPASGYLSEHRLYISILNKGASKIASMPQSDG